MAGGRHTKSHRHQTVYNTVTVVVHGKGESSWGGMFLSATSYGAWGAP